jgi:hypothetical protein
MSLFSALTKIAKVAIKVAPIVIPAVITAKATVKQVRAELKKP